MSEETSKNSGLFSQVRDIYRASRKDRDIFWNVYIARPIAAVLIAILRRTPITPNQLTFLGMAIFVEAAAILAFIPGWKGMLLAAGVLQFSYLMDCADGQLARLKGMTSTVGAYLDFLIDEVKACLLVAAASVRLYNIDQDERYLMVGIVGVLLVSIATSLTTFVRRPEYAGEEIQPGKPVVDKAPSGLIAILRWAVGRFLRWIVHYPSWFVYVALLDGHKDIDGTVWFLAAYLSVYALYVAGTALLIVVKLGRPSFYKSKD
ncbi:MAG: hypothetical protein CMH54_15210 [Myxococcales bacterium]|nr:hypothetical protein [Myxococcales bacterium]